MLPDSMPAKAFVPATPQSSAARHKLLIEMDDFIQNWISS
jgi:hypothetical protein